MPYTLKVTTEPVEPIVSVADAKAYLRIDDSADDVLIDTLISAATEVVEGYVGRALITQTLQLTLDSFPNESGLSIDFPGYAVRSAMHTNDPNMILLPMAAPLQSIGSITYLDTDGDSQTLLASLYRVDTGSEPGTVQPAVGETWPLTLGESGSVTITYDAGYGDEPESVPTPIVHAVKELMLRMYENRDCEGEGCMSNVTRSLLARHRIWRR